MWCFHGDPSLLISPTDLQWNNLLMGRHRFPGGHGIFLWICCHCSKFCSRLHSPLFELLLSSQVMKDPSPQRFRANDVWRQTRQISLQLLQAILGCSWVNSLTGDERYVFLIISYPTTRCWLALSACADNHVLGCEWINSSFRTGLSSTQSWSPVREQECIRGTQRGAD